MTDRLNTKAIMPAPKDWIVFHYTDQGGGKVTPWQWQPLAFVAHVVDDDGVEAIVPMLEGEWGLVLPACNMVHSMCHPAAAGAWLDDAADEDGTHIVEVEALREYLKRVLP